MERELISPERLRPLRRSEYDRLVELGVFGEERLELLRGMLVAMSPQGAAHAHVIRQLTELLVAALKGRAKVCVQLPLALSDESEPEPDVAVVPPGDYRHEHPRTALLVVEVSDSTVREDRLVKARLYAEAGIPEYWIVDVGRLAVERYLLPQGGAYRQVTAHGPTEALALQAFPDASLSLREILPL